MMERFDNEPKYMHLHDKKGIRIINISDIIHVCENQIIGSDRGGVEIWVRNVGPISSDLHIEEFAFALSNFGIVGVVDGGRHEKTA